MKKINIVHKSFQESFIENEEGWARYCCAIVHGAASYLPDFIEYLGSQHANMPIKHGIIGHSRDLETTEMINYRNKVAETYKAGTFRMGFLDNISLVGTVLLLVLSFPCFNRINFWTRPFAVLGILTTWYELWVSRMKF